MSNKVLKQVFNQFEHQSSYFSSEELASGHINDTYLIKTKEKPFYVLQRINHGVFKDVPALIKNKVAISEHIGKKLNHLSKKEQRRRVLRFEKTKKGGEYYRDPEDNYWNLMRFISGSVTHERVTSEKIAYQGGLLMGEFLNLTSDFEASKLVEVIPDFHDMSFRYSQFEEALRNASQDKLAQAETPIDYVKEAKEEMHILQRLKESGELPIRVTHNDTKISNALFGKKGKGWCMIDTDTVMPGIVHYDYGDAVRTICNTTLEDEPNLALVDFNMEYYDAYTKGFLERVGSSLTSVELKYLALGAKTMIFIMGIRFLTDFLNGDIYYKIKYPEHNLNRSKNQFRLLDIFIEKLDN
jgi:serine/threonine protein kinase